MVGKYPIYIHTNQTELFQTKTNQMSITIVFVTDPRGGGRRECTLVNPIEEIQG